MDYSNSSISEVKACSQAPQKFGGSEAVVAAVVGPIGGRSVAAHRLDFLEAEGGQFESNKICFVTIFV